MIDIKKVLYYFKNWQNLQTLKIILKTQNLTLKTAFLLPIFYQSKQNIYKILKFKSLY
ncbi:hypothetical protein DK150_370079 [Flavobacterium psychrophilum]|nr:hypothetical protein DK150_370079 [Flavobacterium psychrophilum]